MHFFQKEITAGTGGDETTTDTTSVQGEYTYEDVSCYTNKDFLLIIM